MAEFSDVRRTASMPDEVSMHTRFETNELDFRRFSDGELPIAASLFPSRHEDYQPISSYYGNVVRLATDRNPSLSMANIDLWSRRNGSIQQRIPGSISESHGMSFVESMLSTASEGRVLTVIQVWAYSVGHVLNDLCAACWFTYLLVFLTKVVKISSSDAGIVMFAGQMADGLATPIVGILSDRSKGLPALKLGRRKFIYVIGTVIVLLCFTRVFGVELVGDNADYTVETVYYAIAASTFNIGWAAVQVAHMAMVPELSPFDGERILLNSGRYAFTILSNLVVFLIFLLMLTAVEPYDNYNRKKFFYLTALVLIIGLVCTIFFVMFTPEEFGTTSTNPRASEKDSIVSYLSFLEEDHEEYEKRRSQAMLNKPLLEDEEDEESKEISYFGPNTPPRSSKGDTSTPSRSDSADYHVQSHYHPITPQKDATGRDVREYSTPSKQQTSGEEEDEDDLDAFLKEDGEEEEEEEEEEDKREESQVSKDSEDVLFPMPVRQEKSVSFDLSDKEDPSFGSNSHFTSSLYTHEEGEDEEEGGGDGEGRGRKEKRRSEYLSVTSFSYADWFYYPLFYLVGFIYMMTRLIVNLSQVYLPLYVLDTLSMENIALSFVPLTVYMSSLLATYKIDLLNKKIGKYNSYYVGSLLVLLGCGILYVIDKGNADFVYLGSFLLGAGSAIITVISVSFEADLVDKNVTSGAFVYGALSFTDKLSNGLAILFIQFAQESKENEDDDDPCDNHDCRSFVRFVLTVIPAASAVAAILCIWFMKRLKKREERQFALLEDE